MTTTINASTSSGLVVTPDNSGNILLQYNGQSAPAFSVYLNGNQTISSASATKIQFNTEEFDTNNNFDSTTNYRFTPTVAGYYQLSAAFVPNYTTMTRTIIHLYKNGSQYKRLFDTNGETGLLVSGSVLAYANGSTDYFEIWGYIAGTGTIQFNGGNSQYTWFTGCLLRGA